MTSPAAARVPNIAHTYHVDYAENGEFDGVLETIGRAKTGVIYQIEHTDDGETYTLITPDDYNTLTRKVEYGDYGAVYNVKFKERVYTCFNFDGDCEPDIVRTYSSSASGREYDPDMQTGKNIFVHYSANDNQDTDANDAVAVGPLGDYDQLIPISAPPDIGIEMFAPVERAEIADKDIFAEPATQSVTYNNQN